MQTTAEMLLTELIMVLGFIVIPVLVIVWKYWRQL